MAERFAGAVEATQRGAGVALLDWKLAGAREVPAHEGVAEKLALGHDAELPGDAGVEHGNIERREMVRGVNRRLGRVDMLGALDTHANAGGGEDHARPVYGEPVLHASATIDE